MDTSINQIFALMKIPPTEAEKGKILKAYNFAEKAHQWQVRLSGEPYFNHAFATGKKLAELGMDTTTICAGLLHDVMEDGAIPEEEFEKLFGKKITFLVNGVTKLGKLKYYGRERFAESLRKLLLATAEDIRVIIIKLADRLHNVQTLQYLPNKEKAQRIAMETIQIYEPIGYRLGMGKLVTEIQDAAFPYAYPKEYESVKEIFKQKKKLNQEYVEKVWRGLKKEMALQNIKDVQTQYRIKSLFSLWRKLKNKDMDIEKVYDIVALRVIVPTIEDCYKTLGVIHTTWRPFPGRIKDYIASPKANGYQSLHTTVFTGDGGIVEIQIRTKEMDEYAEYGFAAHSVYKDSKLKNKFKIIEEIKNLGNDALDSLNYEELLRALQTDILDERIFVFTPDGDVVDLPKDSTPIDFAYKIHTDMGDHISGAIVNGKLVSIKTPLKSKDIVKIETNHKTEPKSKWLRWVKTIHAKREIKSFFKRDSRPK